MQSAMMTPKADGIAIDSKKRLFHRMRKLHGSLSTKQQIKESSVADPCIATAVARALNCQPKEIHCLSVPLSSPDLSAYSGVGDTKTLGSRLTGNFINLIYTASDRDLQRAWKTTSCRISGEHFLRDGANVRERLETPLRSFILEEICAPLWEQVESRLQHPCWQEVEDESNRSLYSFARENVIGIPLLYAVAAIAGATELLDSLEPVLDNFSRFIPFVQIRVDEDNADNHLWLGLDMLA